MNSEVPVCRFLTDGGTEPIGNLMSRRQYEYDDIADTIFTPIYPLLAQQIKEKTGKVQGVCLDLGCGGGHLGLCMAKITKMKIVLLDILPEAVAIAQIRSIRWGLSDRVKALLGDVQHIPVADDTYDLIISRGSLWFWEDQKKALEEIYRILRPGGWTYIGGGYGSSNMRMQIRERMKRRDNGSLKQKVKENNTEKFNQIIHEIRLKKYEIIDDEKGFCIVLNKPDSLYRPFKMNGHC